MYNCRGIKPGNKYYSVIEIDKQKGMAMEENYYLIAFKSTYHGIALEKILQEAGKSSRMIPTPRRFLIAVDYPFALIEDLAFY